MKKLILPLAILLMALLLGAAVAIDCDRLAADGRRRVTLADEEMKKHEGRLIASLIGSPKISPEVRAATENYGSVADTPIDKTRPGSMVSTFHGPATRKRRWDAYDSIVGSFRKTMNAAIDPNNPLDRKFMDDVVGAINRREVAEKQYEEESVAYQAFLNSWRGRVARTFSWHSQADWNMTANPQPTIRDVERSVP